MVIGRFATFESSSVRLPEKPESTKPAVEWISSPRRPSELFPSSRATRSSGRRMRSGQAHSQAFPRRPQGLDPGRGNDGSLARGSGAAVVEQPFQAKERAFQQTVTEP